MNVNHILNHLIHVPNQKLKECHSESLHTATSRRMRSAECGQPHTRKSVAVKPTLNNLKTI